MGQGETATAESKHPPRYFWLLPGGVCLLRLLPYLWSLVMTAPPGTALVQVGYNPKDFLQYAAFIRQVAEHGSLLMYNPFTTEPQSPRFLLLLHWILGLASWLTGIAPLRVLELSRVPLTFLFFGVLWRFLRPIFSDDKDRLRACVLVGLSGGLEGFVRPFADRLPAAIAGPLQQDTWPLFGWNTFESLYNPLWIAALTLSLITLRPILGPDGPRSARDIGQIAAGILLLWWTHTYSAITVLAVVTMLPFTRWIGGQPVGWRHYTRTWLALGMPLLVVALVGYWQAQDEVFRATAGGMLGGQLLSVFWYPLTLGALLVLVLRGVQVWARAAHPYRLAVYGWIAAVVLLHTSPVLNGYHFVFHLHLPLCLAATPGLRETLAAQAHPQTRRLGSWALVFLLFPSCILATAEAIRDVGRTNLVPASHAAVVVTLARYPAGNALVPRALGNLLAGLTPHRVWVGHWFLTPDSSRRAAEYEALTTDAGQFDRFRALLDAQEIRYLVVPRERAQALSQALHDKLDERFSAGELEVLVVRSARRNAPFHE